MEKFRKLDGPKDLDTYVEPNCTVNITRESTETTESPDKGMIAKL